MTAPMSSAPADAMPDAPASGINDPRGELCARVSAAIAEAYPDATSTDPKLTPSTNPKFGDYQANAALSLAKAMKLSPRDVAAAIVEKLDVSSFCAAPAIAGPGFINFTLTDAFVAERLTTIRSDETRLGVPKRANPQRIVVDFSSPNIAKDMHAGHLRSTIIGDTIARTLEFLGHDTIRLNHTGDWGTQFGQLITFMREECPELLDEDKANEAGVAIGDLVEFYKKAKARFDSDEEFKAKAQAEVVQLQSGNEDTLRAWRIICDLSRKEFQKIYDRLDIQLTERGESFYNPFLSEVTDILKEKELAEISDGALVVFLDGPRFVGRDKKPLPVIVQKSNGSFLYATTDLAAVRYRSSEDRAERILYVTDIGQSLHFEQVFEVARKAALAPPAVSLEHVPFGLVQGEDGKKFKTRSGDTVKLADLLDTAAARVRQELEKRFEEDTAAAIEAGRDPPVARSEEELAAISEHIGVAAVKYADLKNNRTSNYKFSYDKMVSLIGDTAPYVMYAFARVQGIYRSAQEESGIDRNAPVSFTFVDAEERSLAKLLLRLPEVLDEMEKDLMPHTMCEYIKTVTQRFGQFYEKCPVLRAETAELQASRLALCGICADTLKLCLGLLGIKTLDRI